MKTLRRNVLGVVYHVIWRFIDRRWYFSGDAERETYLGLLGRALGRSDWRCFAYALMSTHIHLAMLAGREQLAGWSRRVSSPFATWLNEQRSRIGPIFIGPAKDHAILPSKEAALLAYIHNNPVKAHVVDQARASTWTSHGAYIGLAPTPSWLYVDDALARIDMTPSLFASWVDHEPGESGVVAVDRAAAAARKRGGIRVATPSTASVPLVARAFAHVRIDPRRLIAIAAELSQQDPLVVCSRRRLQDALVTRRAIVHAGRRLGLSDSEVADALGLSQQGVSKIGARELSAAERRLCESIYDRVALEK